MSIQKHLPELLEAGIINQDTATKIQHYYQHKKSSSTNRLFVVFGVLGAVLVGLGIILIIAHNWDELARRTKTLLAFLPLLIGQASCIYTISKKTNSEAWRESSAAFVFFAVGASISLISQIYNIPGNISSFLLAWMLLCLPLVYVMRSSIVSLLYLAGITYYASEVGYSYPSSPPFIYGLLLLLILPHYYLLYQNKPQCNFMTFHHWFVPLSVIIVLGAIISDSDVLLPVAYFSLFALLYLIGELDFFSQQKLRNNGYKILGALGTIGLLLVFSFDWYWEELRDENFSTELFLTIDFFTFVLITLSAIGLLYLQAKNRLLKELKPLTWGFFAFIFIFGLGLVSPLAYILINICILAVGILTIRDGARQDNLGILNFGLLVITALVICRFFDTDLSFVIRGILFISLGAGFFITNYRMLKKRKTNEY